MKVVDVSGDSSSKNKIEFMEIDQNIEARLKELRDQSSFFSEISVAIGMAQKISYLEEENKYLRTQLNQFEAWKKSSMFRVSMMITFILGPLKRLLQRVNNKINV